MSVDYDPFSPAVMSDPLPVYHELRASAAVHRLDAYDAWALPRFAEVWAVSRDRVSFSIAEGPVFSREQLLEPAPADLGEVGAGALGSFSMTDPPVHTELRRLLSPPFRPSPVNDVAERLRTLARSAADSLADAGGGDLVADLFAPVSVAGICSVLGIPDTDSDRYIDAAGRFVRRRPGEPGMTDDGHRAHAELTEALTEHVAGCRAEPRAGFVDGLIAASVRGRPLDDTEIATQLVTLIVGGVETMPKVMAGGVWLLERHPEQRQRLSDDPSLAADAFDEMLRLEIPIQFLGRTVTREVDIGGTTMTPGQRALLLYRSANRDEREFADAERFDIGRRPSRHLGFGTGAHVCIGAHLARLEGAILLQELLRSMPRYEVVEDRVERLVGEFQQGYRTLPVISR